MYYELEEKEFANQLEITKVDTTGKQCHHLILVNAKRNPDGTPVSAEVAPYRGWIYMDGKLLLKGAPHPDQVFGFIEDGKVGDRDVSECSFRKLSEGTTIRVLLLEGELYITTNRTLDCSRSRFGKSDTFENLFLSSLSLSKEELKQTLFGSEVTSKFAYLFVLNCESLMIASKVKALGAIYIGAIELDIDSITVNPDEVENTTFSISSISMEEASSYLKKGHHSTESDWTQEPVLAIYPDGTQLKIIPPGYKKRLDLVTNDPNVKLTLCRLLELSYPNIEAVGKQNPRPYHDQYKKLDLPEDYPDHPSEEELLSWAVDLDESVLIPPVSRSPTIIDSGNEENQENRFRRLISSFAFSVHPSRRSEVIHAGIEFIHKRHQLIQRLIEDPTCVERISQLTDSKGKPLEKDGKNIERLQQIVFHANQKKSGRQENYPKNIRSIINIESGNSLRNLMLRFDIERLI